MGGMRGSRGSASMGACLVGMLALALVTSAAEEMRADGVSRVIERWAWEFRIILVEFHVKKFLYISFRIY